MTAISELPALHPTEKARRSVEGLRTSLDDRKEKLKESHHVGSDLDDLFGILEGRLESVEEGLERSVERLGEGAITGEVLVRFFQRLEREVDEVPDVELRSFIREFIHNVINDCDMTSSNEELKERLLKY